MVPSTLSALVPQFGNLKTTLSQEDLFTEVWRQLEKDGHVAGITIPTISIKDLETMHFALTNCLQELSPSALPEFLYRIDVPEHEDNFNPLAVSFFEHLAWRILQREAFKVYFRLFYA